MPSTLTIPSDEPMSKKSSHAVVPLVMVQVIVLVLPSASDALPVTPTAVLSAAFSATVSAVLSESVGVLTSNSSMSVTATVKVVAAVLVSALVAVISTVQLVAVS